MLIAPLQFELGVQLHNHYASKYLIDTLHNLGLCCNYKEVQRYEQNVAMNNDSDLTRYESSQFMQYVADNVAHNIQTIDGHGTFHGMGIIAALTLDGKSSRVIPRLKISSTELSEIGKINVHFYSPTRLSEMRYGALAELPSAVNGTNSIDILWKTHGC